MKNIAALTLVATATTLSLSSCGGETKPKAADAVTKMEARMKAYKTIDMTVSGTQNQKPVSLSLHGPTKGTSFGGTMTTDGQTSHLIQTDGTLYIKASAAYFQQKGSGAYAQLFADKWLKTESSDDADLLSSMMKSLTTEKSSGNPNSLSASGTKVTSDKFNGQDVWKLTSKDGKNVGWITKGDFDLLKASGSDFGSAKSEWSSETITINKHDEPENITAPADSLDLSQLGK